MPFNTSLTDPVSRAIRDGKAFGITRPFDLANDGDTFGILFEVPAASPEETDVVGVSIQSTGQARTQVLVNPNEDTQGDTAELVNRKTNGANAADTIARLGGTNETGAYSGGTSEGTTVIGGVGLGGSVVPGASGPDSLSRAVEPGSSVYYELTADGGAREGSIGLLVLEGSVL